MQDDNGPKSTQSRLISSRHRWAVLTGVGVIITLSIVVLSIYFLNETWSEGRSTNLSVSSSSEIERSNTLTSVANQQTLIAGTPDVEPTQSIEPTPSIDPTPTLFQIGGLSAGDAYIPELGNSGYDVTSYTLKYWVDPKNEYLEGITTISALSNLEGLSRLSLDFTGFDITSVTVDGMAADFWEKEKKLVIQLPEVLENEQPLTIEVSYNGTGSKEPSEYIQFLDYLGLHFPDDQSMYVVSEPDGARYWYPANDHPRDKATFRFEITVPISLTAVANGSLVDILPDSFPDGSSGSTYIWEHDDPMAPYLALLAIGNYERIEDKSPEGIHLRNYVMPELKTDFLDATVDVGRAIDWMSELLVPYPFDEFGFVTASVPGASMEAQTMVLLSENMIGSRTAVHELAHMWFGDWVSLENWNEMWRNEGFATYFQYMWATGDDPKALDEHMSNVAEAVQGNDKNYPLNDPPPQFLFDFNVYQKGALLVHALRREIGDEAFFRGLRLYFERFGGSTASDADFIAVMEEASGVDLDPFFELWFSLDSGNDS